MNAIVLLFNLVPAFPLDGGRIVRGLVWKLTGDRNRGTRVAARLGQAFATLLIGGGLWITSGSAAWSASGSCFVGLMIGGSARALLAHSALNEQLEDVRVADIMDAQPVSVPDELPAVAGARRVLPALPLAVVPRRRRGRALRRRAARGGRARRGRRWPPDRSRCAS